jgi:hypothetical protein
MELLFIDSDADDHQLLCEALGVEFSDIYCKWSQSCGDGINLIVSGYRPDIVFVDAHLIWVKDPACFKALRENDVVRTIPIVNYTESKSPPVGYESPSNFQILIKPSSFEVLRGLLRDFFDGMKQKPTITELPTS